ncbi:MAG: hypothetical protein PV340_05530 [Wolbachia sp.]|nr:hypothetical protein [Wolbachia sp.]MDD9336129.1 hypothetical protein [Wolbachia sp.]
MFFFYKKQIAYYHLHELDINDQQHDPYTLKQVASVFVKALLCTLIAGISILGCNLAIDILIRGQQLLPTILEFVTPTMD